MNKELVQALEKLLDNVKNGTKLSYREQAVNDSAQSHDCWYECKKCKRIINGFGNNLLEQYQGTNKLCCAVCGFRRDD